MSHLVTPYGTFNLIQYDTEQEFERAIVAHVNDIFGERRIYLDCKRRIGAKDGKQSVPDAYVIDLSRPREPQLYVVETKLVRMTSSNTEECSYSSSLCRSLRLVAASSRFCLKRFAAALGSKLQGFQSKVFDALQQSHGRKG